MEQQNTREQLEELRAKSKTSYKFLIYSAIGLAVFSASTYYTIQEAKHKTKMLKYEKAQLIYTQKSGCDELKRELEELVRKDLFQQSYKNQQENIREGIFMYSINESNTTKRQLEISSSLETVCTKHKKRIEEIQSELNRVASSFAH